MSNTRSLMVAMALALVALPVAADPAPERSTQDGFVFVGGDAGWELAQHRYFPTEDHVQAPRPSTATSAAAPSGDFEFVGGETGWRLAAPAYAWRGGRFVRSDPIQPDPRPVAKVTTRDLEETARLYTGG